MTVLASNPALDESPLPETELLQSERDNDLCLDLPNWIDQLRDDWGEPLAVAEWDDVDSYRAKNGWQGRDLVHDHHAPVRVLEYFVAYGQGVNGLERGGVDTTLTGIAHFTPRAESHKGFCHGGSMCSLMDDIIGWCGFLVTGKCLPWTGFTVQINTSLKKPIRVNSYLLVRAKISSIERRKVSITAELIDPAAEPNNSTHATGEGLVILNQGVLPEHPHA
jgi:acyl-coenzyme A thioesterase PaaI-like protein